MVGDQSETHTLFEVFCRECEWEAPEAVDLKGVANVLAGRHISETGHVVALKRVEVPADERLPDGDFYRGGRRSVSFETLRTATGNEGGRVRRCGPVDCVVETG